MSQGSVDLICKVGIIILAGLPYPPWRIIERNPKGLHEFRKAESRLHGGPMQAHPSPTVAEDMPINKMEI